MGEPAFAAMVCQCVPCVNVDYCLKIRGKGLLGSTMDSLSRNCFVHFEEGIHLGETLFCYFCGFAVGSPCLLRGVGVPFMWCRSGLGVEDDFNPNTKMYIINQNFFEKMHIVNRNQVLCGNIAGGAGVLCRRGIPRLIKNVHSLIIHR